MTNLTPSQIQRLVAETLGWTCESATHESPVVRHGMKLPQTLGRCPVDAWWHKDIEGVFGYPPRYHESLDACRDGWERHLTPVARTMYINIMARQLGTYEATHFAEPLALCNAFLELAEQCKQLNIQWRK